MRSSPLLALLVGCGGARLLLDESSTDLVPPEDEAPPPLSLEVDEPAHLSFAGNGPVTVSGHTSHAHDVVTVEDTVAVVGADGSFSVPVAFDGDVAVLRVATTRGDEVLVEHRTVYAGVDPLASWPGAIPVLVTPSGLQSLAAPLGAEVDALDLAGTLSAVIPTFAIGIFSVNSAGGTAAPTEVALDPLDDALFLGIELPNTEIVFDASVVPLPGVSISLGLDRVLLGATLALDVTGDAVALDVVDTQVELDGPSLDLAGLNLGPLDWVLGLVLGVVDTGLEGLVDLALVPFLDLEVPVDSIATDALGFPLELSLDGVTVTEADGVQALLGVSLGVPATATPVSLAREDAPPGTDILVAVPEGLLGELVSSDLLAALDLGTLPLPGLLGEIVAVPLEQLPGGSSLPADRTGMCVTLGLPTDGVGRVRDGMDPLAVLVLPDLTMEVGVSTPGVSCSPWLEAELAVAAGIVADGSTLRIDLEVVDGAVLAYATDGDWTEDEVVAGLDGLVSAVSGLLGSSLAIDLADLVDPALLGGTPTVTSARLHPDATGVLVLGLTIEE